MSKPQIRCITSSETELMNIIVINLNLKYKNKWYLINKVYNTIKYSKKL